MSQQEHMCKSCYRCPTCQKEWVEYWDSDCNGCCPYCDRSDIESYDRTWTTIEGANDESSDK